MKNFKTFSVFLGLIILCISLWAWVNGSRVQSIRDFTGQDSFMGKDTSHTSQIYSADQAVVFSYISMNCGDSDEEESSTELISSVKIPVTKWDYEGTNDDVDYYISGSDYELEMIGDSIIAFTVYTGQDKQIRFEK